MTKVIFMSVMYAAVVILDPVLHSYAKWCFTEDRSLLVTQIWQPVTGDPPNWQLWISPACKVHILFVIVTHLKPQPLYVSVITRHDNKQGPPLHGVLCPDWIKWTGIPETIFSFAAWPTTITNQTLYKSGDCWNKELINTHHNKNNHVQQL